MNKWKTNKLKDIIERFIDYRGKTPTKSKFGIPLITAKIVKNGRILEPNEFISSCDYANWMTRGYPEINDIIITTEAPLGEVALLSNKDVALAQRIIAMRCKSDICNNVFLKYYLQSNIGQCELQARAQGSTVEGIKAAELREIEVLLPPFDYQNFIAEVLLGLDEKIDLLHRQNKTLEAMTETFFTKWFIEEADDSWEEKKLLDIVKLIGGGTPKTSVSEYWTGNIKWLSGGDIAGNHKSFVVNSEKCISDAGLDNSSAKLLPQFATVISARGTVGKFCLLSEPMAFSQSNYGIMPLIDSCFFFTYLLINSIVSDLQSSAYGSVFDTITTTTFSEQNVLLPNSEEIIKFEKSIKVYFDKVLANSKQICTLEKLRDTLLPKLMSGEVRVKI